MLRLVSRKGDMNYSFEIKGLPMKLRERYERLRVPSDIFDKLKDMQELHQECMVVLTIDSRNYCIDRHLVTMGLIDSSLVHPREVFRAAISDCASAIIMAHNHPSGEASPSAEDIRITKQLVEAGKIIAIKVMDHVIIGKEINGSKPYFSMRESGVLEF